MTEAPIHLPGNPPIRVALRRSARSRRLSLRVSRLDGQVTLTMPKRAPRAQAEAFAHEKAEWLRARLSERAAPIVPAFGHAIPVEGVPCTVFEGTRNRLRPEIQAIEISPRAKALGPTVAGLLKVRARDLLTEASDRYATALGRPYAKITLRDTKSRWGSCTAQGALMYSWRLILAPPEVLDYVAAHEVAHLAQMNHSPAFWAEVARLCPGYEAPRRWLRQNGEDLHRFRFAADAR